MLAFPPPPHPPFWTRGSSMFHAGRWIHPEGLNCAYAVVEHRARRATRRTPAPNLRVTLLMVSSRTSLKGRKTQTPLAFVLAVPLHTTRAAVPRGPWGRRSKVRTHRLRFVFPLEFPPSLP